MTDNNLKANDLRKSGDFIDALLLYREQWAQGENQYDGSGLLHCLRKLELFDEAISFADKLIQKYPHFNWAKIEVIWTYIQGELFRFADNDIQNVELVAEKIMALNPEDLAYKTVIFKVLKVAKTTKEWNIVNNWVIKINPKNLSTTPSQHESGREGWSDQALWYNYFIKGLYESGAYEEAISIVNEIDNRFPKQNKFFLRLKAQSLSKLGKFDESKKIYDALCNQKPDWWMLHEYAKVLKELNEDKESLVMMCSAALKKSKLQNMISLFEDIGIMCEKMYLYEEAKSHYVLCKHIRIENDWQVTPQLLEDITSISNIIQNENEQNTLKEAYFDCKRFWKTYLPDELVEKQKFKPNVRRNLKGNILLGPSHKHFCFIEREDSESIFCFKADLPININDNDQVLFDARPSFDKKKNQKSWKACNIRKLS